MAYPGLCRAQGCTRRGEIPSPSQKSSPLPPSLGSIKSQQSKCPLQPVSMASPPCAGQAAGPELLEEKSSYLVTRGLHVFSFPLLSKMVFSAGRRVHIKGLQQSFSLGVQGDSSQLYLSPQCLPNQHNHPQRRLFLAKACPIIFRVPKPIQGVPRTQFPQGTIIHSQGMWPSLRHKLPVSPPCPTEG